MRPILGILTLLALLAGFCSFGWIVHASLNHRLSVFGWSFDKDERSRPFHQALFAIGAFGALLFLAALTFFSAFLDTFNWDL
jgi:hypothetical protein